jgi:hypothetical protein
MKTEFKDGELALRPPRNPAWNGGTLSGDGVVPADYNADRSISLPQRRATARLARSAVGPYGTALVLVAAALVSTLLQRDLQFSEEDAYLTLQRESRQRRKSMKEVAEAIILSEDLKKKKWPGLELLTENLGTFPLENVRSQRMLYALFPTGSWWAR